MERRTGRRNLDRHLAGTPFQLPTSENHGRRLFHQPPPEYPQQNSLFVETDLDQTLESAFSRLNLLVYPHQPPLFSAGLDGGIGNESIISNSKENSILGIEGLPQLSLLEIQQRYAELQRLNVLNNEVSTNVGVENHGYCPIKMGSDFENFGNFLSSSHLSSVFIDPFVKHNDLLGDNEERNGYQNQFCLQAQFLGRGQREKFPVVHSSSRNGLRRDSTLCYNGVLGGFVPKNLNGLSSNLSNRRLKQNLEFISVEDLRGRIVSLAMDQCGCRFLQIKFESINAEEIEMIFIEVIDHMTELMLDQFGNYLIQKLVEVCNEEQRTGILLSVTKAKFQLVSICLNMHGTRAVQKLLECLTTPQQISLVMSALSPGAVALTKDTNGHHVIQHCLKYFSDEENKHLLNEVAINCFGIATDKSGCCVLQLCVEHSRGEPRERLVAEIIANARLLAEDRYGNYVVQHLLGLRIARVTANLLRQLEGNYFSLSCNKYGSNVVEKCLTESGEEQTKQIIMELITSPNASMLLLDPFGNYVIQSALSLSKGLLHNALVNLVETHSPSLRSNLYGKKVLAWLDRKKFGNF